MSSEPEISNSIPSPRSSPISNRSATKSQKTSLVRIVKAQVIILLSSLTKENYSRKASEIKSIIETHGESIRQHLLRFILSERYKRGPTEDYAAPEFQLLKENVILDDKTRSDSVVTFSEALEAFCKTESSIYLDLETVLRELKLNAFDIFVCASLLISSARHEVVIQAITVVTKNIQPATRVLSELDSVPEITLSWALQAIQKSLDSHSNLFKDEDIQAFVSLAAKHLSDKTIPQKIQLSLARKMAENGEAEQGALSKMVLEAGYECCSSPASVRDLLSKTNPKIDEKEVAETLGFIARACINMNGVGNGSSPESSSWNVENFVLVVKELAPDLDWEKVIENLDYEHFLLRDKRGLDIIIRAWKESPKGSELFPANKFFGKWRNLKGQISALYQMVTSSPDVISLVALSKRKVIELEDFSASSTHVRAAAAQLVNDQLNSLDLIERVLDLVDTPVNEDANKLLEAMARNSPELIFLGLVQVQPMKSLIHKDMLQQLLAIHLKGHPGSTLALTKLWQLNPSFFIKSVLEFYAEDSTSLMRILDFTHELKIIPQMLEVQPFFFAIDLAALASRREYLNLEKWLQDKISEHKDAFVRVCLDFLSQKISAELSRKDVNQVPSTVPLQVDVLGLFLKVLSESPMTPDNAELLKEVQSVCLQTYPKLMNIRTQAEPGSTGAEVSFKPEVEKESNSNYERIYSGELSLEEFIGRLKSYSTSKDSHEQDLYACMIHNLFDEYSFFPKYPDKELAITSVLFGSLIQHHLVSYAPLRSALRCVLDSLRKPLGSKMFNFGLQALTQFQSRLPEFPQFCACLLQIQQLQQANPELIRFINASLQTAQLQEQQQQQEELLMPEMTAQADMMPPPETKAPNQAVFFTTLRVPSVPISDENINYEIPPELTQDKILFIINNLALNNLETKTSDLLNLLDQSAYQWFSNYLVVKRASIEPNYHELYLLLLDAVESRLLYQHVLRETYANIQILLNSENTVSSSSERGLLKNLGAWLGGMTLARNKPIKHKNIAFKELLLEGYDNNRLIVVIPFVCKVLEQCNKSRVFKPPNPWLMAILKLLVELYQFAELKLNLKFEIEVLCKSLSLGLNDIEATSVLKNRQPKDNRTVLAEMLARGDDSSLVNNGRPMPGGNPMLQSAVPDGGFIPEMEESLMITLPNLAPYITFNPQIVMYATQPGAKRLVLQAINQSIREIIDAVVERSVSIATVSTRELVTKDFAMESDEIKMRKAAHLMAQNLAGSLAMVTCREPLRLSLISNLRNIFLASGLTEAVAEQTAHITVFDNLELVCTVIEKAAMEKATIDVDEAMMNAYTARKKHREQRPGQPYFDMEIFSVSRYPATLPEPLRSKPNGLQSSQLRVYEDFARISRSAPSGNPSFEAERGSRLSRPESGPFGYGYGNNGHPMPSAGGGNVGFDGPPGQLSAHQTLERFSQYMTELEKLANQTNVSSFGALPNHHDIRAIIHQIPILALSSFDKEEAARTFAQKVVQLLYKSETQLSRETFVVLLENLCEVAPNVGTLVTSWLTHADDERKYNVPVTVALIKSGLIHLPEQDLELGHLIDIGRTTAIDFTARLIRACVFGETPLATRQEFMSSLEALGRLRGNVPESVLMLMEDIRRYSQSQVKDAQDIRRLAQNQVKDAQEDEATLRGQLEYLFTEWVHLYQHPATTEKAHNAFIAQFAQQSIFKVEDVSMLFYRVCIEASVEHAIKFKEIPGQSPSLAYQPIDAFSKLAIGIVKLQTDPTNCNHNTAKVNEFNKVTSVILLILAQHHEQRQQQFNQRPFMRLFTCLLSDLHAAEHQLQSVYIPLLTALSNSFHMLQPSYFPGFTFAWLQLISHRLFMPKLLLTENQKGWPTFQRLLICLFQFLVPFLRNVELRDTTRMLYRGTLRVLLVLLHDFPEFLCDYHYSFCDVIPSSCIQLRNLILSAFPRNMRLPDPFTPNLKVDLLPEINQSPRILSDYIEPLKANDFKQQVDEFIVSETPEDFLSGLQNKLLLSPEQKEASNVVTKYNLPVINALVFYVGVTGITQGIPVNQGAPMEIFQHLLNEVDSEGRYLFLSAIANQLRYPNSHTHYFSCVLLYLFAESNKEIVKEQITRVLLERLIVNRPHPWGLLITFIELIKNPRYNFWNHSFTKCATDIERLFESVSRSINQI